MLRITLIALAGAVTTVGAAQAVVTLAPLRRPAAEEPAAMVAQVAPQAPVATAASISKGADGHFWAQADVNGHSVRFLVDTGATAVALTSADAERLGIRPANLKYGYNVTTAGGTSQAAAVTLASVSVNGAKVENVQALVVSDGLDVSLLGMSYLGRLTRFEATRDTLRFEP